MVCDVAQTGYPKNFRLWRRQRVEYSVALEKISADVHALVTGDAPQGFEQAIPVLFFDRQGGGISCQPAVEPAARCYQGSYEACDGIDDILRCRGRGRRQLRIPGCRAGSVSSFSASSAILAPMI